jgi:hypothetical protein
MNSSAPVLPAQNQLSLPQAPQDPPVIRCKACKGPLPDTTWKNCTTCRRNRTESYRRWKKSAQLRSMETANPSESLLSLLRHSSSLFRSVDSSTSSQAPGPTAFINHHFNEPSHYVDPSGNPRIANAQPPRASTSDTARPPETIEYQWPDELIAALLALPPRSRYIGKFSIVADPVVNNSTRAHLFANQLHARAAPISCGVSSFPPYHLFLSTFR